MKDFTTAISSLALAASLMSAGATQISGTIQCTNGLAFTNVIVNVVGTNCDGADFGSTTTDANGFFAFTPPPCRGTYVLSIDHTTLPADAVVTPADPITFTLNPLDNDSTNIEFQVDSSVCAPEGVCWLTGGGVVIDPLLNTSVAQAKSKPTLKSPDISFGGNINPNCAALAGNWNHIDRTKKLQFKGKAVQVLDCGIITPPPAAGSTSPATPFNYIEFAGTGTLKGIAGNKADYGKVYFLGRCEDHNEPGGGNGANDGTLVDRYYIRVFTNPANPFGSTVLQLGGNDPNPANNTVPIANGNLQMHVAPCQ